MAAAPTWLNSEGEKVVWVHVEWLKNSPSLHAQFRNHRRRDAGLK